MTSVEMFLVKGLKFEQIIILEMLYDGIGFLRILLWINQRTWNSKAKRKIDAFTYNWIVMNYHSGAYCDIALIPLWFFPWSSVFMTHFT